ncbi:MAG: 3-phosphoserine/phosphohydroxythreonine transaminase [Tenericutes bacterium]|jgi:phosphoserine aminotransferase|nr:3-phosphoserine/phosphohydroxythreonine transaminase [Mycoplasmatota bacterium]
MKRVYNFSAGPAVLPEAVLKQAAEELFIYKNTGMSVMEMSHRSKDFLEIITEAEANLRKLMNVPNNYKILFLQGGAHTQFSMIPLNIMKNKKADFITTGSWAKKALKEAKKYLKTNELASSEDKMFSYIPSFNGLNFDPEADYVHICENNTIYGTKYHELPDTKGVDLVSDMSSCILSEPIDVSQYALIYAGAQKNIGPAGTTIVIIRKDLITENYPDYTPLMLQYKIHADKDSMFNTPPTYGIYMCGLVFKHLLKNGGIEAMYEHNKKKASIIYDYLDQSELFKPTVVKKDRSLMNVTFNTGNDDLNKKFIEQAKTKGLVNLKGHRTVGGMRASIYNAMTIEGVEALVKFMEEFEKGNKS